MGVPPKTRFMTAPAVIAKLPRPIVQEDLKKRLLVAALPPQVLPSSLSEQSVSAASIRVECVAQSGVTCDNKPFHERSNPNKNVEGREDKAG